MAGRDLEVPTTAEFRRVRDLPRRVVSAADAQHWADVLTPQYRQPGATGRLRPWQAAGAVEAVENRGGWFAFPVGIGKTLFFELTAAMFGAQRAMLLVPATLRDKTFADRAELRKSWKLASPPPRVTAFSELAVESGAQLLERYNPDLLLIDEADDLADPVRGAPRRIDRHLIAHWDTCPVVCSGGTPSRKSILGYWHQLKWCFGDDGMPAPATLEEARLWAAALDDVDAGIKSRKRVGPGPLGHDLTSARAWYQCRLAETPGIMIIDEDSAGTVPLHVEVRPARDDAKIDKHYQRFLVRGENPFGIPVTDPLSTWRTDGQLGTGIVLRYVEEPPEDWRDGRRNSAKFCRDKIEQSTYTDRPLDTERQVLRRFAEHPIVLDWLAVKDTFTPETEPVVLSTSVIETAVAWLAEDDTPGVVWCGGVDFAHALSAATRLPYYGRKGRDATGRGLHAADPTRSMIASWHANKKGFNLQAWSRILIVHPPQSAKWLEQLMGRHHRSGQDDPVYVTILATSGGTYDAFTSARSEAGFAKASVGLTQKILRANVTVTRPRETVSNRFRWALREMRKQPKKSPGA